MPSVISAGTTAGTAIAISGDTTGNLAFQTNGTTTAMTIATDQRVSIGTSTTGQRVVVGGEADTRVQIDGSSTGGIYLTQAGNNAGTIRGTSSNGIEILAPSVGSTAFFRADGNFQFNSGYGSVATAYGCRAWVNFDGDPISIRASGNVSSITDNGTGDYTVNFTAAMPDANYSIVGGFSREPVGGGNSTNTYNINTNNTTGADVAPTTSGFRVAVLVYGVGGRDINYINLAVFR